MAHPESGVTDDGVRWVEGVVATDELDDHGAVGLASALADSIDHFMAERGILVWCNRLSKRIGTVTRCQLRDGELRVRAELAAGGETADMAWEMVQEGTRPMELTVGWRPSKWDTADDGTTVIAKAKLVHVSLHPEQQAD